MAFSLLNRFRRQADPREALRPLYLALIEAAREPHWYLVGKVADTKDGRFSMLTLMVSLALLRLETLGETANAQTTLLTELFVEDMEGQIRELGIGDVVVGKHLGKMVSVLGGQLGAYRNGLGEGGDLEGALRRNLHVTGEADASALAHVVAAVRARAVALDSRSFAQMIAGDIG